MYNQGYFFVIVLVAFDVEIYVKASIKKATNCGDICSRASCFSANREECDLNTHDFVPRDGDCYCCDACICKNQGADMNNIENICDPKKCQIGKCLNQKVQDCKTNEVLVPKDGLCHCCDTCVNIGGPIKLTRENKTICDGIRCKNQVPTDCKSQQVVVRGEGVNFCCDTCVDLYGLVPYDISDLMYQKPTNCEGSCAKIDQCYAQKKEDCDPKTQIFIPQDDDCYCCDACVNKRSARCH